MFSKILHPNALFAGVLFSVALLYLVRKREMKERYVIFWFAAAVGVLALLVSERLLYFMVAFVGAEVPSAAILFYGLAAMILLNIHYSIKISKLERLTTELVQEVGIIRSTPAGPAAHNAGTDESTAG